ADLVVSGISSDKGVFAVSPGSVTLAPGQVQAVTVTFSPVSAGSASGGVTIKSSDPDESSVTVSVSGSGVLPPEPDITLSVSSLALGDVSVGGSGTGTFTIGNDGEEDLVVSGISSDNGVFAVSPGSVTLAPGQVQTVTVIFSPVGAGAQSVLVVVASNDPDESSVTVSVSGSGVQKTEPNITLSTFTFNIGDIPVVVSGTGVFAIINDSNADQVTGGTGNDNNAEIKSITPGSTISDTFNITNFGNSDLLITDISIDNPSFSVDNNSAVIPPGKTLAVPVKLCSSETGNHRAILTIMVSDCEENMLSFSLMVNCIVLHSSEITLSETSVDLGEVTIGNSTTGVFSITNDGGLDLVIKDISSDNEVFSASPASMTIKPGQSELVVIKFTPSSTGNQNANITVASNDDDEMVLLVKVKGNAITSAAPKMSLANTILDIGEVPVGGIGTGAFTITNSGKADLIIKKISNDNRMLAVSPDSAAIQPGQSKTVTVTFKPVSLGSLEALIKIFSNDPENNIFFLKVLCRVPDNPKTFGLNQNFPNPFNPSTTIGYTVPESSIGNVSLRVYDIRGRLVRVLVEEMKEAGTFSVYWDGRDESGCLVPSGTYFYKMQTEDFFQIRKMILLK
ncbi:MAG TPA: choice-of-anchor D domain-containing protein, partial [archaeon]|nr:choice-of-anchor D domain-containing protein [archaeon]